jgi:putative transposase
MNKQTKLSEIERHILSAVQSGTPITDAFKPMIKRIMEAALEAEMELHMEAENTANTNRRNGKSSKNIKTSHGEFILETPRDRDGSFEPQLVKKRERILTCNPPKNPILIRLWHELFRYSE